MEKNLLIETVVKARQGDNNALQVLYLDMYKSVYFLALRIVKNPEDAEDITQEVYITVQQKIPELREPVAFYGWVNHITVNKCNRYLSKHKGMAHLDDEDEFINLIDDDPMNMPDKALDDEATRKIILEVINDLPDAQRVCVILYYYTQNTIAQIADMLETNENTVKSRLALARGKIRAALEEKADKEGIKLWGVPIALTPILRQDYETFAVPDSVQSRIMEFISKIIDGNASVGYGIGQADVTGTDGSGDLSVTSEQTGTASGTGVSRLNSAVKNTGKVSGKMAKSKLLTIIISIVGVAAIITAVLLILNTDEEAVDSFNDKYKHDGESIADIIEPQNDEDNNANIINPKHPTPTPLPTEESSSPTPELPHTDASLLMENYGIKTGLCITFLNRKNDFESTDSFIIGLYDNWSGSYELTEADFSNIIIYVDGVPHPVSVYQVIEQDASSNTYEADVVAVYHVAIRPIFTNAPATYELSYEVNGISINREEANGVIVNENRTWKWSG